jgi:5-methylcytosine-specific restriction endonuclease McrA
MNVLVLNMDYSPINVTTLQRGFNLVFSGKAEILEHNDLPINTSTKTFKRPTVIRLLKYVVVPFKRVQLTRQNIFRRDDYICLYCGTKHNSLTIDHVYPKSRGGKNTWKNLVTACFDCNIRKGNRTPEEAGMVLLHEPFVPSYLYFVKKMNGIYHQWQNYVR